MQSTFMFLIAIVALKVVTGRYPWQLAEDSGLASDMGLPAKSTEPKIDDYEF